MATKKVVKKVDKPAAKKMASVQAPLKATRLVKVGPGKYEER